MTEGDYDQKFTVLKKKDDFKNGPNNTLHEWCGRMAELSKGFRDPDITLHDNEDNDKR